MMNITSGSCNCRVFENRHDPALLALHCGGRQHQNGLAARRQDRTAHKIRNTGYPGKMSLRHGIGRHLPGQVNGHSNTHRDHLIVAGNNGRIADIIGRMKLHRRIVI